MNKTILSKLTFSDIGNNTAVPSPYNDNNKYSTLIWSKGSTPTITVVDNKHMINISNVNYRLHSQNNYFNASSFIVNDFELDVNVRLSSINSMNGFYGVTLGTGSAWVSYYIKNTFIGGLTITSTSGNELSFNYKFEKDVDYNIIISFIGYKYRLIINGEIIGYIEKSDFKEMLRNTNTGLSMFVLGSVSVIANNANNLSTGQMWNINTSLGPGIKNEDASHLTKYGVNLMSRLNFDNLQSTSTSTVFTPNLESLFESAVTWDYDDTKVNKYNVNTTFTTNIDTNFTALIKMSNNKNRTDVGLITYGNYKVTYNYISIGEPEPIVVVDNYTKSALDFENGLIDKIDTTVWNKEGTASVTNVNKIFGDNSFETKALGDSLYTNSNIITGGATPFTIEFYALIKGSSKNSSGYSEFTYPLISKNNNSGGGEQSFSITNNMNPIIFRNSAFAPFSSVSGNYKFRLNEINKNQIVYDGAAIRWFINDELAVTVGTLKGFRMDASTPFTFYNHTIPSYPQYNTQTKGIIDNINIFDGEARVVRNPDPYEEFLVVDLAFDGENNSTKIVDNAWNNNPNYIEKYKNTVVWERKGNNAIISTIQPFDGFSSLYLDSSSWLETNLENNNVNVFNFSGTNDFTFSLDLIMKTSDRCSLFKPNWDGSAPAGIEMYIYQNKIYCNGWMYIDGQYKTVSLGGVKTININTKYNISLVRKDMVLSLYVNGQLDSTINQLNEFIFDSSINYRIGADQSRDNDNNGITNRLNGYIKNFKIYKGVAVIPESPVGKIQLDFDNNLDDVYNNSTWTNNGVTFDQVNSVKGYSAKFNGSDSTYLLSTSNTNLNFENKNFTIEMDFKSTNVNRNYGFLMSTNHTSYSSVDTIQFAGYGSLRGLFFLKEGTVDISTHQKAVNNQYYNTNIKRYNDTFTITLNNVVIGQYNTLKSNTIDLSKLGTRIGGIGWGSGFSHVGYIDNFKSIKDYQEPVIIDKPTVHLPLETNATNVGFSALTINSIGNPTYTTIDDRKCIKFESGKYLSINSNNIFNLGTSSDFYIEFDFYVISINTGEGGNTLLHNGVMFNTTGCFYFCSKLDSNNIMFTYFTSPNNRIDITIPYNLAQFNTLKIIRKNNILTLMVNDIFEEVEFQYPLNLSNSVMYLGQEIYLLYL